MSSVFKLSIKGVRSFDPIDTETIEFNKPLTLIVGSNGSGKTSIIECLRFATTGDLPPNSKGGAFIHDPNIGGEKSVVAQIKMAFSNINNKNMILTKTLQLINKKTTNTFKTLENQLVVLNNGERVTISTKAADVEALVPQFLGVTKAILNYVIFCHQEDSWWPISEPSILKKRFDEIFDSVKFIKVLDNFKDLRKQFNEDIKLLTNNVEHLKQDRRRANTKRAEKDEHEQMIKAYEQEVEKTSEKLEEITSRMDELFKSNQDYEAVINKIETLQQQNISLKKQIGRLKDQIEFLNVDDDELQRKLDNFHKDQMLQKGVVEGKQSKIAEVNNMLAQKRVEYNNGIRLEAELKSLRSAYENNLASRQRLMEQNDFGLMITEEQTSQLVAEYSSSLDYDLNTKKKAHQATREQIDENEKNFARSLTEIRENSLREEQQQKHYAEDLEHYKSVNRKIESNMKFLKSNQSEYEDEKSNLDDLNRKFDQLRADNKVASISHEIAALNQDIIVLESTMDGLNRQIATSNKQNESLTRSQLLKEQRRAVSDRLSRLASNNAERFEQMTGVSLDPKTCQQVIDQQLNSHKIKLDDELAEYEYVQHDEFEGQTDLKNLLAKLDQLKAEVTSKMDAINAILPEDVALPDYETYMKSLESDYNIICENINVTEVSVRFNEAAVNAARKEKCCMLCRRGFEEHELSSFYQLLNEHTEKLKTGDDWKEKDQIYQEVEDLKSLQYDVTRVRILEGKEIKEIEAEIAKSQSSLKEITKNVRNKKESIDDLKQKISALDLIFSTVAEIARLHDEESMHDRKLQDLNDELFGVEIKSVSALQKEQEEISDELKKKRRRLSDLMDQKEESANAMNRLELRIKEKSLRISTLEKEMMDLTNLSQQFDENKKRMVTLTEAMASSKLFLAKLKESFDATTRESTGTLENLRKMEKEESESLAVVEKLASDFRHLNSQITKYLDEDEDTLVKCSSDVLVLEEEITSLEKELNALNDELKEAERNLIDADKVLRNIRDNSDLRSMEREYNANLLQIEDMQHQNALSARENYRKETNELSQKFSDLKSELAMKKGEIIQLSKQAASISKELATDYKNIDKKYNEEFVKLQTKFFVNNDLYTYSKALDNAIMKFHSIKMKEINEIIDQLWRTTYSGSDVDTIMIKSETNTAGVKSGNRSYNYRVVMVKQGVELDMRGRCSAGQKVLASIIIRLALAECFGINFGMITLDEPTTNLDEDNIESLARSLNQIIEMRRKQKNFQLTVITHDEKFLKFMGAAKFTDLYYRVSRSERQTSVIEAVPISVISE